MKLDVDTGFGTIFLSDCIVSDGPAEIPPGWRSDREWRELLCVSLTLSRRAQCRCHRAVPASNEIRMLNHQHVGTCKRGCLKQLRSRPYGIFLAGRNGQNVGCSRRAADACHAVDQEVPRT